MLILIFYFKKALSKASSAVLILLRVLRAKLSGNLGGGGVPSLSGALLSVVGPIARRLGTNVWKQSCYSGNLVVVSAINNSINLLSSSTC